MHGTAQWAGSRHNSAYSFNSKDYLMFRAYNGMDGGLPKLHVLPMTWSAERWPVMDQTALER